ncbi:MAG: hypothetical protein ACI4MC_01090 [Candidatus Coproplasma sp.]
MSSYYEDDFIERTVEHVEEKVNLFAEKVINVCKHIHKVLEDKRLERELKRQEREAERQQNEEEKRAELERKKLLIEHYRDFIQTNIEWVDKTIQTKYKANKYLVDNSDISRLRLQVKGLHMIGSYSQDLIEEISTLQETDVQHLTKPQLEQFKQRLVAVKDKVAYYEERNKAVVMALLDKQYDPNFGEITDEKLLLEANKRFVEVFTAFDGLLGCKRDVGDGTGIIKVQPVEINRKDKPETKVQGLQVRKR